MAWTAPRTWVTGELVTAALLNTHIRDNQTYIKTEIDKLDDCVQRDGTTVAYASPAGVRAKDTVYQNTSGKTRFVAIAVTGAAQSDQMDCFSENDATPAINVGTWQAEGAVQIGCVTFCVPASWYYEAHETIAVITIGNWIEWDIL